MWAPHPPHLFTARASNEFEIIKKELPELAFRQEILAEFIESESTIFRNIDSSISGNLGRAESERRYFVGVDLAKTYDYTVLIALDDMRQIRGFERFQKLAGYSRKRR